MCVEVGLNYLPVINYSMQQNHVPVIREILIKNTGDVELKGIEISIDFDPLFADRISLHVEALAAGESIRLSAVPVHISTNFLSSLTERIEGLIKVTVKCDDKAIFYSSHEISLLAFDQWSGLAVLPVMLASFVTPNHPEVARILKRASEILDKWTGSPALNEYQTRDPNRVKLQMAAIYEAIAELHISYSSIPASFEDYGQRVRLYSDILTSRLATCLDMTLLYAGCLEAAGLNSLLIIVPGHAFAGAWLIPESFPDSVNDDVSLLTKRMADGINEILPVECTCMNSGKYISFDQAVGLAESRLKEDGFSLFIDVRRARSSRIRPLPQRVKINGVQGVEENEEASEREAAAPTEVSATHVLTDVDHVSVEKQTIWERKLLDLSLRNNLLNTRITKNTLQLISADVNLLEDALAAGVEFQILPRPKDWDNQMMSAGIYQSLNASDPIVDLVRSELKQKRLYSYLSEELLQRALTHLYRSSRLALEENGANTLYMAIGLVKWFENPASTRPRFAPILLLPIEIIRKSAAKGYVIRTRDEDAVLNVTLLEMLRQDFGITLGGLDPLPTDEYGVDVPLILNIFRRAVMAQTGWDIEEQAIIGNFSFNKFIMWNDIHNNADKLSRNKIVASLISGKTEWVDEEDEQSTVNPDAVYPAGTVALPIGADSSQFEAICAAVDGKSFILHGPPGTGKSQTITNIIANALYNGKKVLFVAEKMAALQVVQRRLDAIGLSPFCLELHSNKTKKAYILEQLKATTEVMKRKADDSFRIKAEQINKLRSELNSYVETLHRIYPAGLSLYDCFTHYAANDYPGKLIRLPERFITAATPESIAGMRTIISEYQTISCLCHPASSPLAGIALRNYSASVRTEAAELLPVLISDLNNYQSIMGEVESLLKIRLSDINSEQLEALTEIIHLLSEADSLPPELLKVADNRMVFSEIEEAVDCGKRRDEVSERILTDFSEGIFGWNYQEWRSLWQKSVSEWWLPRFFSQRKVKSQIRQFLRVKKDLTAEFIGDLFVNIEKFHSLQREIESHAGTLSPVLGQLWRKGNADWGKIESATAAVKDLNRQLFLFTRQADEATALRETISRLLECGIETFRDLHGKTLKALIETERKVSDETQRVVELLNTDRIADLPIERRKELLSKWNSNISSLHDWTTYNNCRDRVSAIGLEDFISEVEAGAVPDDSISACFDKSFFKCYAEYILACEPEMNGFHGLLFNEKVERFRQFSAEFERLTRAELYARLASSLPALHKEAAQGSEVGILQRNIRNGGRGTSIRRLFDQIPELLTRMCPCMLMSPISVAQYIDADRVPFDLVIFDEASQMPTSEAVGAIARGKNVIVVGDPKQMPPTTFFSSNSFDEENADKEDMENILEDCLALTMPSKYLLWHYRSRHESLITFSNVKYYANKLLTFPSPDDLATKIGWQFIDGVYDRGRSRQNRAEAEAVVDEIRRRLSDPAMAGKSIGVVTFNSNQQGLIEDLLTDLFRDHPELETVANELEEPIFIKNLENVQGDERDVILFSIGYGPDKDGKIALNFGPLNRDGGVRRLNVAVSRARYEMKIFSSIRADQIDLNRTSAEGVADLKAFLAYAEKGRDALTTDQTSARSRGGDGLVEAIAKELTSRNYAIRTDIGCSGFRIDIGVIDPEDPDRYMLGILCDGRNYHAARTANDRVVTQESVLGQLGWRIHRVWSMDWWENPEKCIDDIIRAIEEAPREVERPKDIFKEQAPAEPVLPFKEDVEEEEEEEEPSKYVEPYNCWNLRKKTLTTDEFVSGSHNMLILKHIKDILSVEAPISKGLLYRRILFTYGISRLGARISHCIDNLLSSAGFPTSGSDIVFYWNRQQDPKKYSIYRPVSDREASDIPPEEIAVAIRHILEEQISLPIENLKKEAAQIFGFGRFGDTVNVAFSRAVKYAWSEGQIVVQDGRVRLP